MHMRLRSRLRVLLDSSRARRLGSWIRRISLEVPAGDSPRIRCVRAALWCARGAVALLLAMVLGFWAVDVNFLWLFGRSPGISELRAPELATATEIRSDDDSLLGRIWLEDRTPVSRAEIPQVLVDALVSTEDVRFYRHSGIDFRAAVAGVLQTVSGSRRGGSTLAQQLAKNLYRTRSTPGLLGLIPFLRQPIAKLREWILASKLEFLHDKDEILVLYLNTVSFGNNTYGIHSAAWRYFGKSPHQLLPEEAAVLVATLKATALYNPILHPDRSLSRRNTVLARMATAGKLSAAARDSLCRLPLVLHPQSTDPSDGLAPHFHDWVAAWLRNFCREKGCDPYTDGLVVRTTLDSRVQAHAMDAMDDWMPQLQERFDQDWGGSVPWRLADGREIPGYLDSLVRTSPRWRKLSESLGKDTAAIRASFRKPVPLRIFDGQEERDTIMSPLDSVRYERRLLQGSLVALDPRTGAILAWVGGIDHDFSQLDHVAGTRRSTGSTAKPFVYCTALEQGMTPCDHLVDSVRTFSYLENGETKYWTPHNADWESGNDSVTLRAGMARSLNTITAQVTMKVGPAKVAETMKRLGIRSALESVPSIGLGSNSLSLLELAGAFQPFVNGGKAIEPWAVRRVEDRHGKVLADFSPTPRQVLSPSISWLMTWMLRGGLQEPDGTSLALRGYDLFRGGRELGGKTGTSSAHADGWYLAVSPQIVAAAWTGNDDPSIHFRSGETGEGSRTALPLVGRFLDRVFHDTALSYPPIPFPAPPADLKTRWNCPTPWPKDSADSIPPVPVPATAPTRGLF
jgi:penicillin-binding protein 1A